MALGERIGKGAKITQNNSGFYFTGNFNASANSMHIALMGDPTLTIRNLPPLQNLQAISENKQVKLYWNSAALNQQYAVYVVDTVKHVYNRVNEQIITDTFYTDVNNHYSGNYLYAVKPIRLETTASGSFYKVGGAAFARVNHVNALPIVKDYLASWSVYPNPSNTAQSISLEVVLANQTQLSFHLFDAQGKEIWFSPEAINFAGKKEYTFTNLPVKAGVYFLQLRADGITQTKKWLVLD
jgi:hypothetical protein